jgi:hypothetical protein
LCFRGIGLNAITRFAIPASCSDKLCSTPCMSHPTKCLKPKGSIHFCNLHRISQINNVKDNMNVMADVCAMPNTRNGLKLED